MQRGSEVRGGHGEIDLPAPPAARILRQTLEERGVD
jgi:hypothetical protein